MSITKVDNKERVICKKTYQSWWKQESTQTFKEALEKVVGECGYTHPLDAVVEFGYGNRPSSHNYRFNLYGVEIHISKESSASKDPLCGDIITQMICPVAKHKWVYTKAKSSDLYIPYFQEFLKNLRDVWYRQYKADIKG